MDMDSSGQARISLSTVLSIDGRSTDRAPKTLCVGGFFTPLAIPGTSRCLPGTC